MIKYPIGLMIKYNNNYDYDKVSNIVYNKVYMIKYPI